MSHHGLIPDYPAAMTPVYDSKVKPESKRRDHRRNPHSTVWSQSPMAPSWPREFWP